MEEKQDGIEHIQPMEEGKIIKCVRIILIWLFLAFLGIVVYCEVAEKF